MLFIRISMLGNVNRHGSFIGIYAIEAMKSRYLKYQGILPRLYDMVCDGTGDLGHITHLPLCKIKNKNIRIWHTLWVMINLSKIKRFASLHLVYQMAGQGCQTTVMWNIRSNDCDANLISHSCTQHVRYKQLSCPEEWFCCFLQQ